MQFLIIPADLNDTDHASAIITLLDEYASTPEGGMSGLSNFVKENLIAELKKRSDCLIILALHKNKPAGLLIGFEGFSTFSCKPLLNIHDIMVSKKYRGNQLSQDLLVFTQDIAKKRHYCKLTLEILEGNKIAKAAYQKFGFKGYELNPEMGKAVFWEKDLIDK